MSIIFPLSQMPPREVASAYHLHNPRVTLIDRGLEVSDRSTTGDLAVRVHVRKNQWRPRRIFRP